MTGPPQQRPTIRLQPRILGEPVAVEAPQPPEGVRLDEAQAHRAELERTFASRTLFSEAAQELAGPDAATRK